MPLSFCKIRIFAVAVVLCLSAETYAQMLARPGWAGSGMNAAPWWKHAVIYRADPRSFGGLHGIAEHLDYIHSVGVDAVLLTSLSADAKLAIDPGSGTMDDFDEIVRRASQESIRVLVELDGTQADLAAKTRLWLVHGVAGFYVPGANADQLAEVRKTAGSLGGQRIVIGDVDLVGSQSRNGAGPQLVTDPKPGTQEKLTASLIRPALEATEQMAEDGRAVPLLLSDGPKLKSSMSRYGDGAHNLEIAKSVAVLLMTTRAGAMVYSGQELGLEEAAKEISFATPPKKGEQPAATSVAGENASQTSLLNWYRQLSALSHSNRTMTSAATTVLNHDDQNVLAWVRRPAAASLGNPPIVVVENLSSQPVTVSLKADMQKLHLRGSFLRTVLRSDSGMGAMHLDGMTLGPYAAFIGELRY
jgi:hypothetical protein